MFLRYDGLVKNLKLSKGAVEVLVKEVWAERLGVRLKLSRKTERTGKAAMAGQLPPLQDTFYHLLKKKHRRQEIVILWGYNILYALDKYMWDADLELFLLCLTGAISEEVFDDQISLGATLYAYLIRADMMVVAVTNNKGSTATCDSLELSPPSGYLTRRDIMAATRTFFPLKSAAQLARLEEALNTDCGPLEASSSSSSSSLSSSSSSAGNKKNKMNMPVQYAMLFAESAQGNQGEYCEEVRDQHLKEILTHLQAVEKVLHGCATKAAFSGGNKAANSPGGRGGGARQVTLGAIREALHKADPSASSPFLDAMICRGSQMDNSEWNLTDMVDYVEFTIHLKRGLVKRCNNYDPTAKFALPTVVAIQARAEKERLHRKAAVRKAAAEKLAMQARKDGAKNRWQKLKDDGAKKDDATSASVGGAGVGVGADGKPLKPLPGNTQGGWLT